MKDSTDYFSLNFSYWTFWSRCGVFRRIYVCQSDFLPREFVRWEDLAGKVVA